MVDLSTQAAYEAAIALAGMPVTFQRYSGFAPNVTTTTASLNAVVRTVVPDTTQPAQDGLSASSPGALNQNIRWILLMAQDLVNAGIALPVVVGDQILVPATGELLNVDRVDAYKRTYAGAIELYASAVA